MPLPAKIIEKSLKESIAVDFALTQASSEDAPVYSERDICATWDITLEQLQELKRDTDFIRLARKRICGVYLIMCSANGRFYIGSSINMVKRFKEHRRDLRNREHQNIHLQRCFDKYGQDSLVFSLIELTSVENVRVIEQEHINKNLHDDALLNIGKNTLNPLDEPSVRAKAKATYNNSLNNGLRDKLSRLMYDRLADPEWVKKHREMLDSEEFISGARQRMLDRFADEEYMKAHKEFSRHRWYAGGHGETFRLGLEKAKLERPEFFEKHYRESGERLQSPENVRKKLEGIRKWHEDNRDEYSNFVSKRHNSNPEYTKKACDAMLLARRKPIVCLNDERLFPSISEASSQTGISGSCISACCLGKLKSAGGLQWRFSDDTTKTFDATLRRKVQVRCVETGTLYNNVKDAAKAANLTIPAIYYNLNGESKKKPEFSWEWV